MTPLVDRHAEAVCAGVALLTAAGAEHVAAAIPAEDWYDARLAGVVDAAVAIGRPQWTSAELLERGSIDRRVDAVAAAVGMYPSTLAGLVARCPVLRDTSGHYTGRVRAAAARRRHALDMCSELEGMGLRLRVEVAP